VIEAAGFTGVEIGWLHTVREIPGLPRRGGDRDDHLVVREQVLALVSLLLLGVATALTAWFPSFGGSSSSRSCRRSGSTTSRR
jgi:hypothetical protein